MVDFVEESAGEGIFGLDADGGAVFKHSLDFDFSGARDFTINSRDRETALEVAFDFTLGFDDFGVDESSESFIFLIVEIVANDDDAAVKAELRRCHGGRKFVRVRLFPFERSLAHFGDDFECLIGDFVDLATFLT